MPIVLRHEAAGIPAGQNPNRKYGQSMVLQQQQADQNMRLRAQDAQYDMQRIGAMAQMRQPSIGEEASMLDQEIRSGLYEPDTVRALRDDERMIGQIMRDRRIDGTQRAQALENIQSRMRMMRATGKRMEPKMQSTIPSGAPPLTQSPKTPQQAFREDPKLAEKYMAMVTEQETNAGVTLPLKEKVARALALYSEYQSALADPTDEKDGQQPAAQQPNAPAPAQGAPSPTTTSAMPPGSFTGGVPFGGISPVLAQGGFQQSGVSPYNSGMNTDPKGVAAQLESYPPKFRLNDGSVVGSVLKNGQWVPETQSSLGGENGGQAMGSQVGGSAYQPTGDINVPTVYGASPVLANTAQQPQYPMEAVSGTKFDPNATVPRDPTGLDSRKWTSADGKFSTAGKIVGVTPPTEDGGFSTVRIKRDDTGKIVDVPMNKLSQQDQVFVLSKGSRDAMYREQNPGMTAGLAIMDPNNPVRQEMSAADQSIVNPQKQTLGEPGGARGLGRINYGQGPSGQNVYADIVPGGIMPVPRDTLPPETQSEKDLGNRWKAWFDRKREEREKQAAEAMSPGDTPTGIGTTQAPGSPALTQLLQTMTPSQRRDYSKWLMEEPNRYAMRNEIAQQQLNQNAAAKGSGQLPTYPGMEARKPQSAQVPTQGKPTRPGSPMQSPMPSQPQAPMQGQASAQGQSKFSKDSRPVKTAIEISNDPNATDEEVKWAASTLASAGFTREELDKLKPAASSTQDGNTQSPSRSQTQPSSVGAANTGDSRPMRPQPKQKRPSPNDLNWAQSVIGSSDTSPGDLKKAEDVLKREGYSDAKISSMKPSSSKYSATQKPEVEQKSSASKSLLDQLNEADTDQSKKQDAAAPGRDRTWGDVIDSYKTPESQEVMVEMEKLAKTLSPEDSKDLLVFYDKNSSEESKKQALKRLGDNGIKVKAAHDKAMKKVKGKMNSGNRYPALMAPPKYMPNPRDGIDV